MQARIGDYLGLSFWNTTTIQGATIQTAADFTMTQKLGDSTDGPLSELYPSLAKVAAVYGDPNGKYAAFMKNADPDYPAEPYFLWNQVSIIVETSVGRANLTAFRTLPTEDWLLLRPQLADRASRGTLANTHHLTEHLAKPTLKVSCWPAVLWWCHLRLPSLLSKLLSFKVDGL